MARWTPEDGKGSPATYHAPKQVGSVGSAVRIKVGNRDQNTIARQLVPYHNCILPCSINQLSLSTIDMPLDTAEVH